MMLFLVPLQSNAITLEGEELNQFQEDFFEDTEGDPKEEDTVLGLLTVSVCGPTEQLKEQLKEQFEEIPVASGSIYLRTHAGMKMGDLYIYVSPATTDYTLVATFEDDGISCILGTGEGFGPVVDGLEI
jgi:hypothetical protein